MYGPAERELRRLGRQCAGVLHLVVAAVACVLVVFTAPTGPGLGAVGALTVWSAGYFLLSRTAGAWLTAADVAVVSAACLTQRWTAPQEALNGSTTWVLAVTSIAVATWQWPNGVRTGVVATAVVILADVAGSGFTSGSLVVAAWLAVEAVLSGGLYHLVRAGAREADRMMAGAERTRRDAAVAAARRADEREHLAAIHDTAAATFHAIGAGVVTGREPWLTKQLANALEEITGSSGRRGLTDLVPLLDDVVRHSPVAVDLSAPETVPLPAAVAGAMCRATREALLNVARHAGVGAATVRLVRRAGGTTVEIADRGAGFDPDRVPVHRRGIALSLVDRMAGVGGRATVTSSVGGGTRVRLEWPDG